MLPTAENIADDDYIFQHDNAPIHTAGLVQRYLSRCGVTVMKWPPQSPDLNPIENLWFILDHILKERSPSNDDELFDVLSEGWKTIQSELLQKFIASMPQRMALVIQSNGMPIRY